MAEDNRDEGFGPDTIERRMRERIREVIEELAHPRSRLHREGNRCEAPLDRERDPARHSTYGATAGHPRLEMYTGAVPTPPESELS